MWAHFIQIGCHPLLMKCGGYLAVLRNCCCSSIRTGWNVEGIIFYDHKDQLEYLLIGQISIWFTWNYNIRQSIGQNLLHTLGHNNIRLRSMIHFNQWIHLIIKVEHKILCYLTYIINHNSDYKNISMCDNMVWVHHSGDFNKMF